MCRRIWWLRRCGRDVERRWRGCKTRNGGGLGIGRPWTTGECQPAATRGDEAVKATATTTIHPNRTRKQRPRLLTRALTHSSVYAAAMRVLVVGGNGFLGSAIVKQAVARQYEVISIRCVMAGSMLHLGGAGHGMLTSPSFSFSFSFSFPFFCPSSYVHPPAAGVGSPL